MKDQSEKQSNSVDSSNQLEEIIDDVQKLPRSDQDKLVKKMEVYSGQFPHPSILKEFENICPGISEEIFETGLENSKKQYQLDEKAMDYTQKDNRRGQWMGFILALVFIIVGAAFVFKGYPYLSLVAFLAPVVGVVAPFVTKKNATSISEDGEETSDWLILTL